MSSKLPAIAVSPTATSSSFHYRNTNSCQCFVGNVREITVCCELVGEVKKRERATTGLN